MNQVDLKNLTLQKGAHDSPDDGGCMIEWASYLAGEPWSDHPACVSPVIGAFCRAWNDALPDEDRTRLLRPYIGRVVGTASTPEVEDMRAWLALDWSVRVSTPTWLRLAGLGVEADLLGSLAPIVDQVTLGLAVGPLAATRSAADEATRSAADEATRSAADEAARSAARSAAWAAAHAAPLSAADAAALSAADAAAWAAARWSALSAGVLAPTVTELQQSALDLLDRMIAVGQ